MLSEEELNGVPLLVFCNKQDVEGALKPEDVSDKLGLAGGEKSRDWSVRGACALKGEGLEEGLDWCVLFDYPASLAHDLEQVGECNTEEITQHLRSSWRIPVSLFPSLSNTASLWNTFCIYSTCLITIFHINANMVGVRYRLAFVASFPAFPGRGQFTRDFVVVIALPNRPTQASFAQRKYILPA
jgi:hypothetical protein